MMIRPIREDARAIALAAIDAVRPNEAVRRTLEQLDTQRDYYLVAVGKAAWQMASAALKYLPRPVKDGVVVTKYGHVMGELHNVRCFEAGHPVPDENSYIGTQAVLDMVGKLGKEDRVLFLLSGGGSALFEKPLIKPELLQELTQRLLRGGADIVEINTVRKRLSAVKGGRFALACGGAEIEAIILSDVLGDPVDMIASGPAAPDSTSCADALKIAEKYSLLFDESIEKCLRVETPKELTNVNTRIIGSVKALCLAAAAEAEKLGYEARILSDRMDCEAKEAGRGLAALLRKHAQDGKKLAFIAGGETVVHVKGKGLGGRNQELALSAAEGIAGLHNAALISVGSDGTDGPTDAAGGIVDGETLRRLREKGIDYNAILEDNDAYHGLEAVDSLIRTGPTGTNVNDVTIALLA